MQMRQAPPLLLCPTLTSTVQCHDVGYTLSSKLIPFHLIIRCLGGSTFILINETARMSLVGFELADVPDNAEERIYLNR